MFSTTVLGSTIIKIQTAVSEIKNLKPSGQLTKLTTDTKIKVR